MRNLLLEEGGLLQVESASLPVASYAKFQPQSVDFLDITNPKAVYPLTGAKLCGKFTMMCYLRLLFSCTCLVMMRTKSGTMKVCVSRERGFSD